MFFSALYTKHKKRKSKVWESGVVCVKSNGKVNLYQGEADELLEPSGDGLAFASPRPSLLDSIFLKPSRAKALQQELGETIAFNYFLVELEAPVGPSASGGTTAAAAAAAGATAPRAAPKRKRVAPATVGAGTSSAHSTLLAPRRRSRGLGRPRGGQGLSSGAKKPRLTLQATSKSFLPSEAAPVFSPAPSQAVRSAEEVLALLGVGSVTAAAPPPPPPQVQVQQQVHPPAFPPAQPQAPPRHQPPSSSLSFMDLTAPSPSTPTPPPTGTSKPARRTKLGSVADELKQLRDGSRKRRLNSGFRAPTVTTPAASPSPSSSSGSVPPSSVGFVTPYVAPHSMGVHKFDPVRLLALPSHIPNTFDSASHYVSVFNAWIHYEMNYALCELSSRLFRVVAEQPDAPRILATASEPSPKVVQQLHRSRVAYFPASQVELIHSRPKSSKSSYKRRRRSSDDEDDSSSKDSRKRRLFLKFDPSKSSIRKKGGPLGDVEYSRDDVWVISSHPFFAPPKSRGQFTILARSQYYGIASSGLMEMVPIDAASRALLSRLRVQQRVYCVHGPNFSSEITMLAVLERLRTTPRILPLLPALMRGAPRRVPAGPSMHSASPNSMEALLARLTPEHKDMIAEEAARMQDLFKLNEDQRKVFARVTRWLGVELEDDAEAPADQSGPVVLVHGTFGSGKSYLLVVIVQFLCHVLDVVDRARSVRILIAAQTNVAVDRLLEGLIGTGFTQFARVGSLRAISKRVLPFVLHNSRKHTSNARGDGTADDNSDIDRDATAEALVELQQMLRQCTDESERGYIREAIKDLKGQQAQKRACALRSMRVVGATCAATEFAILDDNRFSIVLLDECSQMIEPLSLLPLARFSGERVLAVGDPKQLPPVLASVSQRVPAFAPHLRKQGTADDPLLSKALFVRLTELFSPVLLRTQYRCHPTLGSLANGLFYDNALRNGSTPQARAGLLSSLPPLTWCDVQQGNAVSSRGGSIYNEAEVKVVRVIISAMLSRGVEPHQIGVIAAYKAQGRKLAQAVSSLSNLRGDAREKKNAPPIQVATVDAFQGAEREIIIVSLARSRGVGFLDSPLRANVALTRARRHLIVVGNATNLRASKMWRTVSNAAQADGSLFGALRDVIRAVNSSQLVLPSEVDEVGAEVVEVEEDEDQDAVMSNVFVDDEAEEVAMAEEEQEEEHEVEEHQVEQQQPEAMTQHPPAQGKADPPGQAEPKNEWASLLDQFT